MAKIKLGALAQDARGSLAGTTFSRNRFGSYVRQKVSPIQPRTERQLEQRATFTEASQLWRTLTDAQRALWASWAGNHPIVNVFGDAQSMTALNAFIRVSTVRALVGFAPITSPPADQAPGPLAEVATVTAATGVLTVDIASPAIVGQAYVVFATRGLSPGKQFVSSDYRFAGSYTTLALDEDFTVNPPTVNPLINFVAGQRVGVLVACVGENGVYQPSVSFGLIAL